jgi:hypothetical protein
VDSSGAAYKLKPNPCLSQISVRLTTTSTRLRHCLCRCYALLHSGAQSGSAPVLYGHVSDPWMLLNLTAPSGPPWPCPLCAPVRHTPPECGPNSHLLDDPLQTSLCLPPDDLRHLRTALTPQPHSHRNSPCLPLHRTVLRYSYDGTVQVHLRWVHIQRVHPLRHTPRYIGVTWAPSSARSGCTLVTDMLSGPCPVPLHLPTNLWSLLQPPIGP